MMFTPAKGSGRICETYILEIYLSRLRELDAEMFGNSSLAELRERLVQAAERATETADVLIKK